jgi:dsDNA-binding SOS-regulon protein
MSRRIEVEYILKNEEGIEVARFQNIDDAKHYDRMLAAADEIFNMFSSIKELDSVKEAVKDDISFQLAKHSDEVLAILSAINGKKKSLTKKEKPEQLAGVEELRPAV